MTDSNKQWLTLDLQTFAEPGEIPTESIIDPETPAEAPTPESVNDPVDKTIPYDRFKAKVDEANALKIKLAEFETAKLAEQQKTLEEQNDFKTLYEQAQLAIEAQKADVLEAKKSALLAKAGYTEEQAEKYKRYIEGNSDEELANSLEGLVSDIPPQKQYIDPSSLGGNGSKPKPKDAEDVGRGLFQRLRGQ